MMLKIMQGKKGHPYLTSGGKRIDNARFVGFAVSHDGKKVANFNIVGIPERAADRKKAKLIKSPAIPDTSQENNDNENTGDVSADKD